MIEENKTHPLISTKKDIKVTQDDLTKRMEKWKDLQALHMPRVKDHVLAQNPTGVDDENLFLPSYFGNTDRVQLDLTELASEEAKLREGHVYECILQLRRVMKSLSVMQKLRRKNKNSQRESARLHRLRNSVELMRDRILEIYNSSRMALESHRVPGSDTEELFPPLSLDDLYRKSTLDKRVRGDTFRPDGSLWGLGEFKLSSITATSITSPGPRSETADSRLLHTEEETDEPTVDIGKLWSPVIGLSGSEIEKWEIEGSLS
jgi:hypothetical protein